MNLIRYAITSSISVLTFVLHLIGSYLLWKTYKWRTITTQQLLIFNICLCECFINIVWLFIYIFERQGYGPDTSLYGYFIVIQFAFDGVLYMLMIFITLDRLMAVALGLKYPQYWTVERTKTTLVIIWSIGSVVTVSFLISNVLIEKWYQSMGIIYFNVCISSFYILLAMVTYIVLFTEFKKSRDIARQQNSSDEGRESPAPAIQTFLKSRFYVSVLIISTYLIFNTIPFCAFITSYKDMVNDKKESKQYCRDTM